MLRRSVNGVSAGPVKLDVILSGIGRVFAAALVIFRDGNSRHEVIGHTGGTPAVGNVRDLDGLVSHSSFLRAGFDTRTIAEAGAVTSRLGGGLCE